MDKKKIIIIGIILFVIAAVIFLMLTAISYERIYITPNGTTIEVPANQTEYDGNFEGVKIWHWNNGILVTYNNHEDPTFIQVTELGFNTLKEIIKNGEKQDIKGFTCYVINADELFEIQIFDIIKVHYNGKFYCIPLTNESTHDNILICCNNPDIAVHMAESVEYKNVYPDNVAWRNAVSTVENMSGFNLSDARNTINNINLSDARNRIDNINLDDARNTINNINLDDARNRIDNINLSDARNTVENLKGFKLDDARNTVENRGGFNLNDARNTIERYTGKLPFYS